jgi:hypothetical protein
MDNNTSRKHCKKEPQLFFHCDFFDHSNLQLLNDCKFFFYVLWLQFRTFWALLERYFQGLIKEYQKPPNFLDIYW